MELSDCNQGQREGEKATSDTLTATTHASAELSFPAPTLQAAIEYVTLVRGRVLSPIPPALSSVSLSLGFG